MHLNTLAGRTFNDLTQYPVFPFIISDYDSEELDVSAPNALRDLTKPMGAQDADRLEKFEEKYEVDFRSAVLSYAHRCSSQWVSFRTCTARITRPLAVFCTTSFAWSPSVVTSSSSKAASLMSVEHLHYPHKGNIIRSPIGYFKPCERLGNSLRAFLRRT